MVGGPSNGRREREKGEAGEKGKREREGERQTDLKKQAMTPPHLGLPDHKSKAAARHGVFVLNHLLTSA